MGIGIVFTGFSQVPLYEQDFETGLNGWIIDNTNNGTWALGTPAGGVINSAASGVNSFATNLAGNYSANDNSDVTSPAIDISAATGFEKVSMNVWWSSENSWDGANLFGSYDGGATWAIIGANGDPDNWYNDGTINGTPNGSSDGWTGTFGNSSGGWVTATHTLNSAMLLANNTLMLRVGFGSDGAVFGDGFAFDDVKIAAPTRVDLSATAIAVPVQCSYSAAETVTVTVCNIGDTTYNTGATIPVSYSFNGGIAVNENFVLLADLLQGNCVDYIFTATADFSTPGAYTINSWTSYPSDIQTGNDTVTASIFNSNATIPYFENFEAGTAGWAINNNANGSWEYGTPAASIINSAASGDSSFVTNLTGNYNADEDGYVESPCVDISAAAGTEVLAMKVWWSSENSWDGANLFGSFDGGTTWSQLGAVGDPNNWYNDNSISGNPQGSGDGWTGTGSNGSAGWVAVEHTLNSALMTANTSLLLRVGFGSDGGGSGDGFAFDDVAIGNNTATYEYGVAGTDSVSVCDPSFTIDAGAGYPFYYIADLNNNFNSTWTNNQTLDVTSTGLYVITVTDAAGMIATDTVFVEIKDFAPPVLTDVVSCVVGDSAMFDAGSGTIPANLIYTWSTGDTTETSLLFSVGTVFVTKTDTALGCFASDTAIFTNTPIFSLGNDTIVCEGEPVVLNPGSALFYLWSDGTSNPTLTVNTTGLYYVEITSSAGCIGSDTLDVTVNAAPVLDLGIDDLFCIGNNTALDAGTATSYLWNDGSTNQTLIPAATGNYSVTKIGANGCEATDSVFIILSACVGVDEFANGTAVKMFPNPTQGNLTVKLAEFNNDLVMNILTIYGQVVRSEKVTSTTTVLDLNDLSEGTYILQLKSKDSISVNKFIINR